MSDDGGHTREWQLAALDTADRCWDGIVAVVTDTTESTVNQRLSIPGSNSVFAIAHHCVEMTLWWLGTFGCGLDLPRDRAGEFEATGTRDELLARIAAVRSESSVWTQQMLDVGIAGRDSRGTTADVDLANVSAQWVVLHVIHELAQHLGQMQITRDAVRA